MDKWTSYYEKGTFLKNFRKQKREQINVPFF